MQRRPNLNGGWSWGLGGAEPVPFRLPQLVDANFVAIVEGEKDAVNVDRLGIVATCNNGGAGNFKPELAQWFASKTVVIFPDNDAAGRKHALQVAKLLAPVAATIRIVELPNLPAKGDVSDFIAAGGTREDLLRLYNQAQDWTPEWEFSQDVPTENEKYVRTLSQAVAEAGGIDAFWNLSTQEGVATPFPKLTRALGGGLRAGEVYVIGGNQGSGKTSLALQFIIRALQDRCATLMFSMEMGWRDVFQRIVSIEAEVDLSRMRDLQREARDRRVDSVDSIELRGIRIQIQRAMPRFIDQPLFVSTRAAVTPEYLLEESLRFKKKHRIGLVVVDHMQLMSATTGLRSEYEKFTAISRATKQTAVELGVPVLLVSQTSRSNSSDRRSELEANDLRGSGAIEEDAAAVMLLYPDKDDRERTIKDGSFAVGPVKTWLKLAKNRYGLQGSYLPLPHHKSTTRF
jgi:replicative DNA helicase